ncbi:MULTISPECIES: hypothetical protein [Methylomonas]|uniref:hypothetical protein n=1 Tax=Methylomonas TaxID=416 RepID=UPI000AE22AE6|nr:MULTISPECIES: hypothetical protein [Methylomonas]WGS86564.1 hypothetical protein QC632_02120 [Methylomonas sp. UP202]
MKTSELTKGVMAALLLSSSMVVAQDYPAADYQPKVLYSNPDYANSSSASNVAAPAAKVVETVEADPNYPATNFQPKVLYSDSAYKHDKTAPSIGGAATSVSSASSDAVVESASAEPAKESSNNALLGLVGLAAVGFFLYSRKSGSSSSGAGSSSDSSATSGEATGVEKYIDRLGMNKTGVAKYLEKQGSNQTTGVARYMAKQIVKDREAAAAKATGVEKYLRDRG